MRAEPVFPIYLQRERTDCSLAPDIGYLIGPGMPCFLLSAVPLQVVQLFSISTSEPSAAIVFLYFELPTGQCG